MSAYGGDLNRSMRSLVTQTLFFFIAAQKPFSGQSLERFQGAADGKASDLLARGYVLSVARNSPTISGNG